MKPLATVQRSLSGANAEAVYSALLRLAEEVPPGDLPSFFAELERARWTAQLRNEALLRAAPEKRDPRRLLTAEELAETLRVSTGQIYRMAKGALRSAAVEVAEGTLRFDSERVARFLESRLRG